MGCRFRVYTIYLSAEEEKRNVDFSSKYSNG
jgi:hypothetical protein